MMVWTAAGLCAVLLVVWIVAVTTPRAQASEPALLRLLREVKAAGGAIDENGHLAEIRRDEITTALQRGLLTTGSAWATTYRLTPRGEHLIAARAKTPHPV